MITITDFLAKCRVMACHNLLCYSKTYSMNTPKDGCETQFAEAQRDLEIVEELIRLHSPEFSSGNNSD
ncbi:MAG: hypothetical protein ACK5LX_00555 [Oscillospiraceae bacterium]